MTTEDNSLPLTVNVAILDDDQRVGLTIRTFLKPLKCHSTIYTDPQACLDAITQEPVDILITDLCMPGMSGLDVLERVKKTTPETDVIVITGTAGKDEAINALKLGAFDFFEKPVEQDAITLTVSRTLRYRQLGRERDLLAKLETDAFDIVMTDRAMLQMSGDVVATRAKRLHPEMPVILVTGFGELINDRGLKIPGVDLVVSKPVSRQLLKNAISTVLPPPEVTG